MDSILCIYHPSSACMCFHCIPKPGSTAGGELPSQPLPCLLQHHCLQGTNPTNHHLESQLLLQMFEVPLLTTGTNQNHFEVMLETNQPYLHCQASKWANWAKLLLGWRPSPCRGVETLGIMKQKTLDVSCFRERTPFCGINVPVSKQWISPKNQGIPRW